MPFPSVTAHRDDPLRTLFEGEAALLEQALASAPTGEWLLLDATALEPPLPRHPWLHLRCAGATVPDENVRACDGTLPFPDASIGVTVLRHALEFATAPRALLDEALRVLEPGGLLLVTGLHPWSPWRPWLARRAPRDGAPLRPRAPGHFRRCLMAAGLDVDEVQRFGPPWPGRGMATGGMLAAAYVLRAHKRRATFTAIARSAAHRRVAVAAAPSLAGVRWRQGA